MKIEGIKHGGAGTGYSSYGCRCDECREAHRLRVNRRRQERAAEIRRDPSLAEHGTWSTYGNWMCRCGPCRDAGSEMNAYYASLRKQAVDA